MCKRPRMVGYREQITVAKEYKAPVQYVRMYTHEIQTFLRTVQLAHWIFQIIAIFLPNS